MTRSMFLALLGLMFFGIAGYYFIYSKIENDISPNDTVVNYTLRVAMNEDDGIKAIYMLDERIDFPIGKENDPKILAAVQKVLSAPTKKPATMFIDGVVRSGFTVTKGLGKMGEGVMQNLPNLIQGGDRFLQRVILPKLASGQLFKDIGTIGTGLTTGLATGVGSAIRHIGQGAMRMGNQFNHFDNPQSAQNARVVYVHPKYAQTYTPQYPQGVYGGR